MTGLRAAGGLTGLLTAAAAVVAGTLLVGVPAAAAHPGDTSIQLVPAEAEAGSTVTTVDDEGHVEAVGSAETSSQLLSVTADPDAGAGPLGPLSSLGLPVLLLAGGGALMALVALVLLARRRGPVGATTR